VREAQGLVDATALGWRKKNEDQVAMSMLDHWVYRDDGPFPFEWPAGYTAVRVDEEGKLILEADGQPYVRADPGES